MKRYIKELLKHNDVDESSIKIQINKMKLKRTDIPSYIWLAQEIKKRLKSEDIFIMLFIDGYNRLCDLEDAGIYEIEFISFAKKSVNVYYKHLANGLRMYDTIVCKDYSFDKATAKKINNSQYLPSKFAKVSDKWYSPNGFKK